MKRIIIVILGLLVIAQAHAQLLATAEDAEKAIKVVMICSADACKDNSVKEEENIEITVLRYGNNYSVSIPSVGTYELPHQYYRKIVSNHIQMERDFVLFHKEDTVANPTFTYHSEVGNTGIVNSSFCILFKGDKVAYTIRKCIFISKEGLAHNYYCDRANSLDSDLLVEYFGAMKIKKENSSGVSSFFGNIKKKASELKDKTKKKKNDKKNK